MTEIFHFTNVKNLPTILADGGLWSDSECAIRHPETVRSGNIDIKQRRLRTSIPAGVGKGGFVGDYVPFYFAPRSPMLYSISCGNVPGVSADQDRIIYFAAAAEDFSPPEFVATDGNAAKAISTFFGTHQAIADHVDWPLMRARMWKNTDDDGDRMRRRMAELLVHRFIPWERVRRVVVRVPSTKEEVERAYATARIRHRPEVTVEPSWYYD